VSHGDVTLTGVIETRVRELNEDGDEVFGAVAELHLRVSPTPSPAWQGLWRSDAGAPETIEYRTSVSDDGFIVLELTDESDIESDMREIVEHTIRTNDRWHELNEQARSAAERAVAALGEMSAAAVVPDDVDALEPSGAVTA